MEEISGKVEQGPFAVGSKSDRSATFITTEKGRFVLRRRDGNPYQDPELETLVGKRIRAKGVVTGYTFLISDWIELQNEEP